MANSARRGCIARGTSRRPLWWLSRGKRPRAARVELSGGALLEHRRRRRVLRGVSWGAPGVAEAEPESRGGGEEGDGAAIGRAHARGRPRASLPVARRFRDGGPEATGGDTAASVVGGSVPRTSGSVSVTVWDLSRSRAQGGERPRDTGDPHEKKLGPCYRTTGAFKGPETLPRLQSIPALALALAVRAY